MSKPTKRTKGLLAALAVAALGVLLAAVALAQDESSGGQAAPSANATQSDVPEGPYVDFCPTPEQTETHLKLYGFDYKPTVACTREGQAPPPTPEQRADTARDPDEGLSADERIARLKQVLLTSRPAPDPDGDPSTIEGVTANGRRFEIDVFGKGDGPGETTPAEFARTFP